MAKYCVTCKFIPPDQNSEYCLNCGKKLERVPRCVCGQEYVYWAMKYCSLCGKKINEPLNLGL